MGIGGGLFFGSSILSPGVVELEGCFLVSWLFSYRVSQGIVLSLMLFNIHMEQSLGVWEEYADDTQLHFSFMSELGMTEKALDEAKETESKYW